MGLLYSLLIPNPGVNAWARENGTTNYISRLILRHLQPGHKHLGVVRKANTVYTVR